MIAYDPCSFALYRERDTQDQTQSQKHAHIFERRRDAGTDGMRDGGRKGTEGWQRYVSWNNALLAHLQVSSQPCYPPVPHAEESDENGALVALI